MVSVIVLYIWGIKTVDDLILGYFANIVIATIAAFITGKSLPFSREAGIKESSGRTLMVLLNMIFPLAIGFSHYFLIRYDYVIIISIPFMIALSQVLLHLYKQTPWKKIVT